MLSQRAHTFASAKRLNQAQVLLQHFGEHCIQAGYFNGRMWRFYCWLCNYHNGGWNSKPSLDCCSSTHWINKESLLLCSLHLCITIQTSYMTSLKLVSHRGESSALPTLCKVNEAVEWMEFINGWHLYWLFLPTRTFPRMQELIPILVLGPHCLPLWHFGYVFYNKLKQNRKVFFYVLFYQFIKSLVPFCPPAAVLATRGSD